MVLPFFLLAFLLGFKHSYDADHIIPIANLLRKVPSMRVAVVSSLSWAVGHMLTATLITVALYTLRDVFSLSFLAHFESIVAVMLIALGAYSLWDAFISPRLQARAQQDALTHTHKHIHKTHGVAHAHVHAHTHADARGRSHTHKHLFGIGIIHGLASNDELLILFTASLGVSSLPTILWGVAVFSAGVVLGMILFSALFIYPLVRQHSDALYRVFALVTGVAGILYGTAMLLGVV